MSTQNNNHKTTIIKQNIKIILIAEVPSSQELPAYLSTAPPSVCVPDVLGVLAVWIQNQKKKLGTLAVSISNPKKKKARVAEQKAKRQHFIFPYEFGMCSQYQPVEDSWS